MRKIISGGRGLALASLSLLFSVSCDLGNSEGGPGSGPGVPGQLSVTPALPPLLRTSAKGIQPEPNSSSDWPSVSADGRYAVFYSYASNLVAGDSNGDVDVFVRDRDADENGIFDEAGRVATILVSIGTNGVQGNSSSYYGSISDDGRFVAFYSNSDNLDQVTADTNFTGDIFVHDRDFDENGVFDEPGQISTVRVSVDSNGAEANQFSELSEISADGRFVVFMSYATNLDLVTPDTNGTYDIYVHNRDVDGIGTGAAFDEAGNISTVRISFRSDGNQITDFCYFPYISSDGRFITFYTYDAMVPDDTNGNQDIYIHDRDVSNNGVFDEGGDTSVTRVSVDSTGANANSYCSIQGRPASDDGRFVVFYSSASNLSPEYNGQQHIYLRDRDVSNDGVFDEPGDVSTQIISKSSGGALANGPCYFPSISADGQTVAFMSLGDNLVPGDTNFTYDIFVRNLATGVTVRASVSTFGAQANSYSYPVNISRDGSTVVFRSQASNLVPVDTNGTADLFARDLVANRTVRVSEGASTEPGADSFNPTVSADGDFVVFESDSTDIVANDTNGARDVFLRKISTGVNVRVSVGIGGVESNFGQGSFNAMISGDGRFVAFQSTASNFNPADGDANHDIFVRGLSSTVLASRASGPAGVKGNAASLSPSISFNGRFVAFESIATNLHAADADGISDVFVRDLVTNNTILVSRATGPGGVKGNGGSNNASISGNGQFVVFESAANNLVAGDSNGQIDIFIRDLVNNTTARVNVDSAGNQATLGASQNPSVSDDGRYVTFQSTATNLVAAGTTVGRSHVYVRDLLNLVTTILDFTLVEADDHAANAVISGDGRFVAFDSLATNLVAGDANTVGDVFRFAMTTGLLTRISLPLSGVDALPPTAGQSRLPAISKTGDHVVFESRAKNLTSPPELGAFSDIYRIGN